MNGYGWKMMEPPSFRTPSRRAESRALRPAALARCIERRTHYDTAAVDSVAAEAARLWRSFYADEPPG